jgi:hypothetical protein
VTSPVVTIELTADGVQEVSARIRTAEDVQQIAHTLERLDRAVRKQVHARHEGQGQIRRQCTTSRQSPENLRSERKTE